MLHRVLSLVGAVLFSGVASAQDSFVNWENPHVHPLELTNSGARLLAVNTADHRLEVFDVVADGIVWADSVAVGIDPVSVRARTNKEAWVVNHISDSVSIVHLPSGRVKATLLTDDEPCDVVFAGSPQRAFVTCSQANTVLVFDPQNLNAAPTRLTIDAEDPRALAVSPDGNTVYAAVFESGNGSTILGGGLTMAGGSPPNVVNDPSGPYAGVNPPPNDGAVFDPPENGSNPAAPAVGLVVKKDPAGNWLDDNGSDWTSLVSGANAAASGRVVGWDLPDRDLAIIDANTLAISYTSRLMNMCMALAVNPNDGKVSVIGTDATNEIRFEPVLKGTFLRVLVALVDVGVSNTVKDLNDHLSYATSTVAQTERDKSLGDPRGMVWNSAGTRAYITGMGSNNVIVVDENGDRAGINPTIEVGQGPTGIALDEARQRAYVLNKFDGSISVIDTIAEMEISQRKFFDPTPKAVTTGRPHLYDTHRNSGLGQIACASCHVDARMDRLSWDLGDPAGDMKSVAGQNLAAGIPQLSGTFEDFHPMKGPMLTQTMQDIIGKEPHHWRGDRDGLEEFDGAFMGLQGDDTMPSLAEMQEFEAFLATVRFPPNPFRNFDNTLPDDLELTGHFTTGRFAPAGQPLPNGDATRGLDLYRPPNLLDTVSCATCHTLPTGLGTDYTLSGFTYTPISPGPNGERHHALVPVDGSTNVSIKIPHLRNLYDRVGFETTQTSNNAGFGFLHDGSVDSLARFLSEPVFSVASDQDVADLVAFMLAFSGSDLPLGDPSVLLEPPGPLSKDSHAAVGKQTTVRANGSAPIEQVTLIAAMLSLADAGDVAVVAHGRWNGEVRGYTYLGGSVFQSDRAAETISAVGLFQRAWPGTEVTYTVVPVGTETRLGIDRDEDGFFDHDEVDACSDPADAQSVPGPVCPLPYPPPDIFLPVNPGGPGGP